MALRDRFTTSRVFFVAFEMMAYRPGRASRRRLPRRGPAARRSRPGRRAPGGTRPPSRSCRSPSGPTSAARARDTASTSESTVICGCTFSMLERQLDRGPWRSGRRTPICPVAARPGSSPASTCNRPLVLAASARRLSATWTTTTPCWRPTPTALTTGTSTVSLAFSPANFSNSTVTCCEVLAGSNNWAVIRCRPSTGSTDHWRTLASKTLTTFWSAGTSIVNWANSARLIE